MTPKRRLWFWTAYMWFAVIGTAFAVINLCRDRDAYHALLLALCGLGVATGALKCGWARDDYEWERR